MHQEDGMEIAHYRGCRNIDRPLLQSEASRGYEDNNGQARWTEASG